MGVREASRATGEVGVQPEWFYKGDGSCIVAPGAAIPSPDFALDGSEEPEIAGSMSSVGDGHRGVSAIAWRTSFPITSRSAPTIYGSRIRSCARRRSAPSCSPASFPPDIRGTSAESCAKADALGDAVPHR